MYYSIGSTFLHIRLGGVRDKGAEQTALPVILLRGCLSSMYDELRTNVHVDMTCA